MKYLDYIQHDEKKWEFYIGKVLDHGYEQLEVSRTGRRSSEFAVVVFSLIAWLAALTSVDKISTFKLPLLEIEVTQEFSKALLPSLLCAAYIISICAARRWVSWYESIRKTEHLIYTYFADNKIPENGIHYPRYFSVNFKMFAVPSSMLGVFGATLDEGIRKAASIMDLLSIILFHGLAFGALWHYSYGSAAPALTIWKLELGKALFYLPMIIVAFLLVDLAIDE